MTAPVTTQAELEAAVAGPRVVTLAGGVFAIELDQIDGVTFRAADPADPPVIAGLRVTGCTGLTFDGLAFWMQETGVEVHHAPWHATECRRIVFRGCTVSGRMEPAGRGHGLTLTDCGECTVERSDFTALRKGLILRGCTGAVLPDLSFRAMSEDGIGLGACKSVVIDHVRLLDFWGEPGLEPHSDAVDLGHAGCEDITITRLIVVDAATRPPPGLTQLRTQGVFAKTLADRVTVRNSLIAVSSLNGVAIGGGEGIVAERAPADAVGIIALADDATPAIKIPTE